MRRLCLPSLLSSTFFIGFLTLALVPLYSSSPVSAATIPTSFTNIESCKSAVAKFPAASIVSFGQARADNRTKALKQYETIIQNKYKARDTSLAKAVSAYKKKIGSVPAADVSTAKSGEQSLLQDVATSRSTIDSLRKNLEATGSKGSPVTLADQSCRMIFDLKIYSFMSEKIKAQYAIDNLYAQITINNIRKDSVTKFYEKNQNTSAVKALKGLLDGLPDPNARLAEVDKLQNALNGLSAVSATADKIKPVFEQVSGVKADIIKDSKPIASVSAKVTAAANKKAKTARPSTSKNTASKSGKPSGRLVLYKDGGYTRVAIGVSTNKGKVRGVVPNTEAECKGVKLADQPGQVVFVDLSSSTTQVDCTASPLILHFLKDGETLADRARVASTDTSLRVSPTVNIDSCTYVHSNKVSRIARYNSGGGCPETGKPTKLVKKQAVKITAKYTPNPVIIGKPYKQSYEVKLVSGKPMQPEWCAGDVSIRHIPLGDKGRSYSISYNSTTKTCRFENDVPVEFSKDLSIKKDLLELKFSGNDFLKSDKTQVKLTRKKL